MIPPQINQKPARKQSGKASLRVERRQFPRYSIQEFECTVFCEGMQNPHRLINIGAGGLCFQVRGHPAEPLNCETVDILCIRPDRLYLPGVICRLVYDIDALSESMGFRGAETRRCGLQFTCINSGQNQKLMNFLRSMPWSGSGD